MNNPNIYVPEKSKRSIFDLSSCKTQRAQCKVPNQSASPKSISNYYPTKFKVIRHPDEAETPGLNK